MEVPSLLSIPELHRCEFLEKKFMQIAQSLRTTVTDVRRIWNEFYPKYENLDYAFGSFSAMHFAALHEGKPLQVVIDILLEEHQAKLKSGQYIRMQAQFLEENPKRNFKYDLIIAVTDAQNPGIEIKDTLLLNMDAQDRKEAKVKLKKMSEEMMGDIIKKYGGGKGKIIDMLQG